MAKYNFNLREATASTETPINFVIRWDNNRLVYPTNETIHPKYWQTDKGKSDFQRATNTKRIKSNAELNSRLDSLVQTAKELFRKYVNDKGKQPSVEVLRELLNIELNNTKESKLDFFGFVERFIEEAKIKTNTHTGRTFSEGTIKIYKNCRNHLKEYAKIKRKRIDFDTIDLDFYLDFKEYLTTTKKFSTNTIGRIIKTVKTFLNEATERGINENLSFRSKRFRVISEKADNVYLTENELNDLYFLNLTDNPKLERVRDLFLVGCYTGLRFSDFSKLRPQNIGKEFIEIETQKTAETVVIPKHPKFEAIFEKYDQQLPRCISNQKFNDYLKDVCELVVSLKEKVNTKTTKGGVVVHVTTSKYNLITSHTARRSFATNAYLANVPPFVIMGITGHKTEKSFFNYIKITSNEKAKILQMYMQKQTQLKAI